MTKEAEQLLVTLLDAGLAPTSRGKVREMLDIGPYLIMVTTDRLSAFDTVLPTAIPGKGQILNSISAFWFKGLALVLPTHFVSDDPRDLPEPLRPYESLLEGRWMLVRPARTIPVECIVRGYLAGSGWREYERSGAIGGRSLAPGLRCYQELPEPVFTPSTKSHEGHDVNISPQHLAGMIGTELAARLERTSLEIYRRAARFARERGLVLADAKFEFGWIGDRVSLIDEALTPDSSRYWPVETVDPGAGTAAPKSLDKEYVRQYLKSLPWDGTPPAPRLPPEVVAETRSRYQEVERRLLSSGAPPDLGPALVESSTP